MRTAHWLLLLVSLFFLSQSYAHFDASAASPLASTRVPVRRRSVSTSQTAARQLGRLFSKPDEQQQHMQLTQGMAFSERIVRITVSWLLLFTSKSLLLAAPLYYRRLIDAGGSFTDLHQRGASTAALTASAMGLVLGYGGSRLAAGFVQLASEFLMSPATTVCAESLPLEAFACALVSSAQRSDGPQSHGSANSSTALSAIAAASGGQDEGRSGFARRALDRGLRASNQFLYRSIFSLLPALLEGLAVLVLICAKTSPAVGATAAVVATAFVLLSGTVMKARIPIMRQLLQQEGIANGVAEDALTLADTVAAFGATDIEVARYARSLAGVSRAAVTVRFSFSALKMMQAGLLGLGASAIAFVTWRQSTSALEGATNTVSVAGQLVLVQALFAQLCAPLDHVGQHFRDCVSAAEDLRELECIKAEGQVGWERVRQTRSAAAAAPAAAEADPNQDSLLIDEFNQDQDKRPSQRQTRGKAQKVLPSRIELRNVSFAYAIDSGAVAGAQSERAVLHQVSFAVPAGGYAVGIVGPSGSGKSTLLRVLLGLESLTENGSSGQLLVDGVDVTGLHRIPLFSMVGQDSDLFRGLDLAGNVRYGTDVLMGPGSGDGASVGVAEAWGEADRRALTNAARDAQLQPLLASQANGWSSAVGPRGRLLSGGERQRVCLARALYRQELTGGILLMDEVTASLDAQTESLVTRAILDRVKKGETAVLIAHRLSSVRECNLILVLRDGVVAERGTHAQLMRKGGWYAQAVRLQGQGLRGS